MANKVPEKWVDKAVKLRQQGLILIDETDTDSYRGNLLRFGGFVKRAKARDDWYELSPTGLMHYLRIGCMKWVNR